jgi:tRNA-Thr(GGU) m(6)t(6)A37 methyltransferase TsaA
MITFQPIGYIKTPFTKLDQMPIQALAGKGFIGEIELNHEYVDGLKDLEQFSHIMLFYHLNEVTTHKLQVIPFLDDKPHGIFATRSPLRPNPIGFSIVKLINITGNIIIIEDVDILCDTPLIDIKPYISKFDYRENVKNGWVKDEIEIEMQMSDNRFI